MFKIFKEEIELGGKKIILETGKIARQADGAIIATCRRNSCYFNSSWSKKS